MTINGAVVMTEDWFVEFYPADANKPEKPIYFDGFTATLSHIQSVRSRIPTGQFRVHVPARATGAERRRIREEGAIPN